MVDEGSSFLDINLDDAQEPMTVEPAEYQVQVIDAKMDKNKRGNDYVLLTLEVPSEPASKAFTHYLGLPGSDDSPKQLNQRKWNMKVCFEALDYDYNSQPVESMIGAETWALVGEGEEDPEYGKQNYIRKWLGQR